MENYNIYDDIAKRTNGDIYIGVVGPVRCGKSTFITQFMQTLVLPNIKDVNTKERAIDELPQSSDGTTIMTTQPRFVPNDSVKIKVNENTELNVRMIDCVGYLIDGAKGHIQDNRPRLLKTPWSDEEMSFEEAAELGTRKVINEHSTIAVAMTCDGSIAEIPRSNYIQSEERIVEDLKANNKPFVMVLNSRDPKDAGTIKLAKSLQQKYDVPVLPLNASKMSSSDVDQLFTKILAEFPIKSLQVNMPKWMSALPYDDPIISNIINETLKFGDDVNKIGDVDNEIVVFAESEDVEPIQVSKVKMGEGKVVFDVQPKASLFYKVLSNQCGQEITDDYHLVSYVKQLGHAKEEYDKLKEALESVEETGYGVVVPKLEDMTLDDPKIVKQGSKFGVKLKASAPSLHLMRVDIETEINPIVGTEQQSNDLVKYLMDEFENDPKSIWDTNMFGKSLHSLVKEGLNNKVTAMPIEAQKKMRRTLGRIVNEGKGGIICILL